MTAPHSPEAVLEAALRYAADGYHVFPIRRGTKAPHRLVPGGFKDATAERAAIERWFQSAPDIDAIAAVPNSVRCAVIDIDTKADGFDRLAEYEARFGKLPETRTTVTPTGGEHRWFRLLQGVELQNHIGLFGQAGVDLIARSGYVLMPPSRHPAGGHYEEDAADAAIAELPNAWLRALSDPNATRAGAGAKPRGRHETLVARAVSLTKNGAAPENVSRRLHALNATFPEPKGRAEVDSIAEWTSGRIESDSPEMIELRRLTEYGNDAANAAHFAARCRGAAVYDATDRRWRVFGGKRWERDATGGIMRFAKATANELLRLATSIESEDARKAAVSYAIRLGGRRQLEAMIDLAKSELPAIAADFDADPFTLNVENGILDLRTGALRDHDPAAYLTKLAPVEYHEGATAPRWERFLDEIFLGRSDLIDYVHRLVGYALTADVSEHVLPIAYGLGANGKSVFVGALQKLLGDYALHADVSLFLARREHGATPELARLKGVRLVAASEMPEGGRLSENLIKSLTGGDRIAARHLYGEFFEFAPTAKFMLATNYKPVVRGDDDGIWRRLKLLPFEASFAGAAGDRRLPEVLESELPGILRWAVEGCLRWQQDGLGEPKPIVSAMAEYRSDSDAIGAFLGDRCVVQGACEVRAAILGAAYKAWAEASSERAIPARVFRTKIRERGFTERRAHGDVIFRGLGLRDDCGTTAA